jgi:hypothetical protein
MSHDVVMGDDPSQKRKRSIDDHGERDEKKAHFEGSRLGIEDLHLDVGEKYLLCQTRKAPSTPSPPHLDATALFFSAILAGDMCESFH